VTTVPFDVYVVVYVDMLTLVPPLLVLELLVPLWPLSVVPVLLVPPVLPPVSLGAVAPPALHPVAMHSAKATREARPRRGTHPSGDFSERPFSKKRNCVADITGTSDGKIRG
jgi:hypothetical protein